MICYTFWWKFCEMKEDTLIWQHLKSLVKTTIKMNLFINNWISTLFFPKIWEFFLKKLLANINNVAINLLLVTKKDAKHFIMCSFLSIYFIDSWQLKQNGVNLFYRKYAERYKFILYLVYVRNYYFIMPYFSILILNFVLNWYK